jgi:hypothetical protein
MTNQELNAYIDYLLDECEKSGVEDATDWERWDELENAMYVLAERECGIKGAVSYTVENGYIEFEDCESPYDDIAEPTTEFDLYGATERDELLELVEAAEAAASDELKALGCIEQRPQFDWNAKGEHGEGYAMVHIIREEWLPAELW